MPGWGEYFAVFSLGVAVGLAEILSRYPEAPLQAARKGPGLVYMGLNGAVSLAALWIFGVFKFGFGLDEGSIQQAVARVVVAGFGALAFFRSSFKFRTSDSAVSIGPGETLDTFFATLDLEISRSLASRKAASAVKTMASVDYAAAEEALPMLCIQLLRANLNAEDQSQLGEDVASLAELNVSSEIKKAMLGVMLLNAVGEGVLEAAVKSFKSSGR